MSYNGRGVLHLAQWDGGVTIDSPLGMRPMQTFKKLPTSAPKMKTTIALTITHCLLVGKSPLTHSGLSLNYRFWLKVMVSSATNAHKHFCKADRAPNEQQTNQSTGNPRRPHTAFKPITFLQRIVEAPRREHQQRTDTSRDQAAVLLRPPIERMREISESAGLHRIRSQY